MNARAGFCGPLEIYAGLWYNDVAERRRFMTTIYISVAVIFVLIVALTVWLNR